MRTTALNVLGDHSSQDRDDRQPTTHQALVDARSVNTAIAAITVAFFAAAVWTMVVLPATGSEQSIVGRISTRLFDVGNERTLPTAWSSLLLLASAAVVAVSTTRGLASPEIARYRTRWRLLAVVLAGISADEAFSFHEELNAFVRDSLALDGFLFYAWVVPYSLAALLLACSMIAPLLSLPTSASHLIVLGGACYVTGAVGAEMVGAYLATSGASAFAIVLEELVEEFLEMIGVWLFLAGMLRVLQGGWFTVSVR